MKKAFLTVILTIIAALAINFSTISTTAQAEEINNSQIQSKAQINLIKKTGGFIAGLASGYLFHEGGHAFVALTRNVPINWNVDWGGLHGTIQSSSSCDKRAIGFAGFGAHIVSTELILGIDSIPKDNAYILGWLTFNTLNSIAYSLRNEFQKGGYGDFKLLKDNGVDVRYVEAVLISHALLSAYRVYYNPKFIPYVQMTHNEFLVGIMWVWD